MDNVPGSRVNTSWNMMAWNHNSNNSVEQPTKSETAERETTENSKIHP